MLKICEICGGPLSPKNKIGICSKTPLCLKENQRRNQAVRTGRKFDPLTTREPCEICGSPVSPMNTMGVCMGTLRCKQEYKRRRNVARVNYSKAWYATNSDSVRQKIRVRGNSTSHTELTYLMFSPGLNTHKIGKTVNLERRKNALHCGCWDIELVTTFPYGHDLEQWLHAHFKANRIKGTEWFTDLTEVDVKNAVAEYELELAS